MAPAPNTPRTVSLMGVKVVDETVEAAVRRLAALARGPGKTSVFFVNAHTLNYAARDAAYRDILNGATVLGDGTGVRWAARARGVRLRANLNGTDLIPAFLTAEPELPVFLLGSTPEGVAAAQAAFRRKISGVRIVGARHGYVQDEAAASAAVAEINAVRPAVLLVAMGNPLQEQWIDRWRADIDAPLAIGVGGLFEYVSETYRRAPAGMRARGLEWLHVTLTQRWKARRYLLGAPLFLARMMWWLPADMRAAR